MSAPDRPLHMHAHCGFHEGSKRVGRDAGVFSEEL